MGFFDKVKEKAQQLKEENRNMGKTMKRINNSFSFYGNVNRGVKDGDFWEGSYVSIEDGSAVIYGSAQDDYVIARGSVTSFNLIGDGPTIPVGDSKVPSLRFAMVFADGKKAQVDIIYNKVDAFKAAVAI